MPSLRRTRKKHASVKKNNKQTVKSHAIHARYKAENQITDQCEWGIVKQFLDCGHTIISN